MRELEGVDSVGKFLQVVSTQSREWAQAWAGKWPNRDEEEWLPWFRGEQSAVLDTALQPKLYRPGLKISQLLHQEQELRLEFRRCGEQLIQERRPADKFEWYFLMAHCAVPTRLLDWTDGALLALYFAIRDRGRQGHPYGAANAAVYMIDPWWLNDLAFAEVQPSTKKRDRTSGVALSDWREVKSWLPEDELDSHLLRRRRPLAIDPSHFSRRIAAQRSHFILFGKDMQGINKLAPRQGSKVIRIPIDVSDVAGMLRDLKTSGISESMIFPDVDGLGRELKLAFDQRCRVAGERSNRLAQPKPVLIELRPSKVHRLGVGVFATANLKKDQWIAEGISRSDYQDLVLWRQSSEYPAVVRRKIRDFCVGTPKGFIPPAEFDFGSLSIEWYFNHSCDGNVGFNAQGDFVAKRPVKQGEELTYDYGLAESNPGFRMRCTCGTRRCRKVITGNDWRTPRFRAQNLKYMLAALRTIDGAQQSGPSSIARLSQHRSLAGARPRSPSRFREGG